MKSFGERFAFLLNTVKRGDGRSYTYEEIAKSSDHLTVTYLSALKTGRKSNPSLKVIDAISAFFDVSPNYFFDDQDANPSSDDFLNKVALRSTGLSKSGQDNLLQMLEHILDLEEGYKDDTSE